jgi:hypothetical protein
MELWLTLLFVNYICRKAAMRRRLCTVYIDAKRMRLDDYSTDMDGCCGPAQQIMTCVAHYGCRFNGKDRALSAHRARLT